MTCAICSGERLDPSPLSHLLATLILPANGASSISTSISQYGQTGGMNTIPMTPDCLRGLALFTRDQTSILLLTRCSTSERLEDDTQQVDSIEICSCRATTAFFSMLLTHLHCSRLHDTYFSNSRYAFITAKWYVDPKTESTSVTEHRDMMRFSRRGQRRISTSTHRKYHALVTMHCADLFIDGSVALIKAGAT